RDPEDRPVRKPDYQLRFERLAAIPGEAFRDENRIAAGYETGPELLRNGRWRTVCDCGQRGISGDFDGPEERGHCRECAGWKRGGVAAGLNAKRAAVENCGPSKGGQNGADALAARLALTTVNSESGEGQ